VPANPVAPLRSLTEGAPWREIRLAREAAATLWWLYWAVVVLFAVMAYLVVGVSISGWVP